MTNHPRIPAVATLLLSLLLGIGALAAAGQFRSTTNTDTLAQLEAKIAAGQKDAATWEAYADALRAKKAYATAAAAYDKALQLNPEKKSLRFNSALSLGLAGDNNNFFEAINHLSATDPKQAVEVLERPELELMHNDPRYAPALKSAHSQAAD